MLPSLRLPPALLTAGRPGKFPPRTLPSLGPAPGLPSARTGAEAAPGPCAGLRSRRRAPQIGRAHV